jgi:hypothetical protein
MVTGGPLASTTFVSAGAPVTPVTHPRPMSLLRALKILAILLVIGGVALAAFLFFFWPKTALGAYLVRFTSAKTSTYAATVSSDVGDGTRLALKLSGSEDLSDAQNPKIDMGITGEVTAASGVVASTASKGSLSGHIINTDHTVYFKIESLSILSDLFPITISKDWYKYDYGDTATNKCLKSSKGSGNVLGSAVLTDIPVKNTTFGGLDTINGTQMLHYTGTVDNSKLKQAIDDANKNLSADCKLDVSADDFKNVSITYELWRGFDKDRLKATIVDTSSSTKSTTEMTLDTGAYNKPVSIKAPAGAKDVKDLLNQLLGGVDNSASNDSQRETDLKALQAKASAYAAAHKGIFPATAAIMAQQGFDATDPTSGQPYQIVATTPTAVGQIQYIANAGCDANGKVVVKPSNSKKYALTTMMDDTSILCLDSAGVSSRTPATVASATPTQKANDTRRKTDLTTIRKDLEEYFVNNNVYPATLAELTKGSAPIMKTIPTDPTGKSPYLYVYTPANNKTTYTLDACLENSADNGSDVIAPVAPCTTKTFELVNGN